MRNKLLRIVVSAVLLARIASRTDWDQLGSGFAGLRWELWLAAVLVLIGAQILSAWRWKHYTDQLELPNSVRRLTSFYFIGMFFNLMLPTSVGGDVVRAWYLDGKSGRRVPAFTSVILDRLNGLVVLVALACVGVAISPLALPDWITWSVYGIASCAVLGLGCAGLVARLGIARKGRLAQLGLMADLFRRPRILLPTLLLSVGVQAANVLLVWLIGQAIGASIPAAYYWILVPMVSLVTLLPISVNGMGVREEATVLFLAPLGVAEGTALTLSILWFAVYASVSLMGGAVYMLGHFPKPETQTAPASGPARAGAWSPDHALPPEDSRPIAEVTCGSIGGDSDQGRARQHRHAA